MYLDSVCVVSKIYFVYDLKGREYSGRMRAGRGCELVSPLAGHTLSATRRAFPYPN